MQCREFYKFVQGLGFRGTFVPCGAVFRGQPLTLTVIPGLVSPGMVLPLDELVRRGRTICQVCMPGTC